MRVIPGWMVEARTASVDELGFKMIKLAFSSLMRSTSGQLNHILPSMQYMAPALLQRQRLPVSFLRQLVQINVQLFKSQAGPFLVVKQLQELNDVVRSAFKVLRMSNMNIWEKHKT